MIKSSVLSVVLFLPSWSNSFVISPSRSATIRNEIKLLHELTTLFMSDEEEGTPTLKKRRRKRKKKAEETSVVEAEEIGTPTEILEEVMDLRIREAPVELQVQDIREAVGGVVLSSPSTSSSKSTPMTTSVANIPSMPAASTSANNDSFASLLEDAKRMQAETSTDNDDDEEGGNVKAKVRNVLSTIVTADFFVVCFFLLWFLVGIISRSITDDATIQIAFNSKYS
jgi:hypothetical protein